MNQTALCRMTYAVAMFLGVTVSAKAAEPATIPGSVIDELVLRDHLGRKMALADLRKRDLTVIAFLGTECPLAKLYGPRLAKLAEEFESAEVNFLGVNSNVQDSLTEVAGYTRQHGITFPVLMDNQHQLADAFGARRTPEVFVVDRELTIQYRGRVDDQFAIGVQRQQPARRDLAEALRQLIDGKPVSVATTDAVGCIIGRRRSVEPRGDITWSGHIAGIFGRRCMECHRQGEIAPFPLTQYEDTIGWEGMIAEVINEGRMPPWNANPKYGHFKNDARLTDDEKQLVLTWIANGCPKGDEDDMPPLPEFADGWRIEKPDRIVYMRDEPFDVPATGVVDYQYFRVDPEFTEDTYIVAAEARPGNTAVVHHIIAYVQLPGRKKHPGLGNILIGYAPGTGPLIFPKDAAMLVPAGSKLIFELHYTPNGMAQSDRSYIGLKFADPEKVKSRVVGGHAINHRFRIPPRTDDHVVTAETTVRTDTKLLLLTPHMHLRGKSFRYEAMYPDGRNEVLLDVPRYDFNWQLRYEFAEPPLLPKGTRLKCTAWYDNSAGNLNNPDPDRTVGWGQQSWEEMMIGFYTGMTP